MTDNDEKRQQSLDLLNNTHDFPTEIMIKVVGVNAEGFTDRVVAIVQEVMTVELDIPCRTRSTPNGRHLSVTLEPRLDNAEQVLAIYARLRTLDGVVFLL